MMKRYLTLLGFLFLFSTASHAQTYSTGTTKACVSGTSCATTTGISVSTGDFVAILVRHGTTTSCPQSTDTMADSSSLFSFGAASVCSPNGDVGIVEMFLASASGSNASVTFTAGFAASRGSPVVIVLKYTGVATSSFLDQTAVSATATTNVLLIPASGSFTTTQANEVIIACGSGDGSSTTWTAGAIGGVTATVRLSQAVNGSSNFVSSCEDLTVTSIQTAKTAAMSVDAGVDVDTWGFVVTIKKTAASTFSTQISGFMVGP